MEMYWHNYDTGEYDYREAPTTLEEAYPYLPNSPTLAARSLLEIYVKHKEMDLMEAMTEVLTLCIPEEHRL